VPKDWEVELGTLGDGFFILAKNSRLEGSIRNSWRCSNIDVPNIAIVLPILGNSITHAYTYVIVVLCVHVATHEHLPSKKITLSHAFRLPCAASQTKGLSSLYYFNRQFTMTRSPAKG
jgi:hypothetical protein